MTHFRFNELIAARPAPAQNASLIRPLRCRAVTRGTTGFALVLSLITSAATPALAQSFDCDKATKHDELAVCGHRALADLDVEMATLWWQIGELPMMMGERGAEQDAQRAFLGKRRACRSDIACIRKAYEARIGAMKATISEAMQDYCKATGLC